MWSQLTHAGHRIHVLSLGGREIHELEAVFSLGLGKGLVPRVDHIWQGQGTSSSSGCPGL